MRLEEIFTFENLYDAYKQCRKSKQHKGEVIRFEANLSYNINKLVDIILYKDNRQLIIIILFEYTITIVTLFIYIQLKLDYIIMYVSFHHLAYTQY